MKTILAAGTLAAAGFLATVGPSSATTIPLGTFSGSKTATIGNTVSGSFTDDYTFTLATFATLTRASITNSFADASQFISSFTVSLFKGLVGAGTQLGTATATTLPAFGFQFGGLSKGSLGTGNYYVEVTGKVAGTASYGGSVAVSAVPLPTSVALFGVALAGLGAAGAIRRKAKVQASA